MQSTTFLLLWLSTLLLGVSAQNIFTCDWDCDTNPDDPHHHLPRCVCLCSSSRSVIALPGLHCPTTVVRHAAVTAPATAQAAIVTSTDTPWTCGIDCEGGDDPKHPPRCSCTCDGPSHTVFPYRPGCPVPTDLAIDPMDINAESLSITATVSTPPPPATAATTSSSLWHCTAKCEDSDNDNEIHHPPKCFCLYTTPDGTQEIFPYRPGCPAPAPDKKTDVIGEDEL